MGNRFGVKDFVALLLRLGLLVSAWLSMKQRDREWDLLQSMASQSAQQSTDLSAIRRILSRGVQLGGGTGVATSQPAVVNDPFVYLKQAQDQPDFAPGDWLVDNFEGKIGRLTPFVSTDLYSHIVESRVTECLGYLDPDTMEYRPMLASSWTPSDDGLTYTFQLRKGVTFSDGQPLTADDVVWTFNWIENEAVQAPQERAQYDKVKDVRKISDYEVAFHFKERFFQSLGNLCSMKILPKHFYSKYTPQQFNDSTGLLMGSGPYRMKDPTSWKPGDQIELVRNERYWGEPPTFDRVVYYQVEEESAYLTMFKNREVDIFAAEPEQYRLLLKDPEVMKRVNHFELDSPLTGYAYVAWNQKRNGKPTPFADKRVRQAMTMLTDRQRICSEVFLGYAYPVSGPFFPGSPQEDPSVKLWPYDPDRAKALLREAGYYDRDGSGTLTGPDGRPFEITLSYPSKYLTYERVVLFLKDSYARAGIKLNPDPVDFPILLKKLSNRDFDAISLAWAREDPEDDIFQMFDSSQIQDNGDDFMSYQNPELDKLIRQARTTVDEKTRMPMWQACHRILHEDQPYTFLFSRKSLVFVDNRIHNVRPSKLALNYVSRFDMPIPWYVPKAMQKWGK